MEKARKTHGAQSSIESPSPTDNHGVLHLRVSRKRGILFAALAFLFLAAIGIAGLWLGKNVGRARESVATNGFAADKTLSRSTNDGVYAASAGPWGDLECQLGSLQPPDECLTLASKTNPQTTWFFKDCSAQDVTQILLQIGLSAAEQKVLLNTNAWQVAPGGITVLPPAETVFSLSSDARRKLYTFLGQFTENVSQHDPFYWHQSQEHTLFENAAHISPGTRALVKRLTWKRGELAVFADLPAVVAQIKTQPEKLALEKTLSSKPAVFLKLKITPESDIDSLIRYWGVGGSAKYAEPGLEALTKLPEGRRASIFSVLPPFAREHLYTFPNVADPGPQDGLWTAFNFFKEKPEPPTTDATVYIQKLGSEYYPVFSDPRFGDILLVTAPNGSVLQVGVFLADNFVFTKTSARASTPWNILRISDLQEAASVALPDDVTPQIAYYRSKND